MTCALIQWTHWGGTHWGELRLIKFPHPGGNPQPCCTHFTIPLVGPGVYPRDKPMTCALIQWTHWGGTHWGGFAWLTMVSSADLFIQKLITCITVVDEWLYATLKTNLQQSNNVITERLHGISVQKAQLVILDLTGYVKTSLFQTYQKSTGASFQEPHLLCVPWAVSALRCFKNALIL